MRYYGANAPFPALERLRHNTGRLVRAELRLQPPSAALGSCLQLDPRAGLARLTFKRDLAFHQVHQRIGDRKAQAESLKRFQSFVRWQAVGQQYPHGQLQFRC